MVKKSVSKFVCNNCGAQFSAWSGRCSNCGEWNTLQEEAVLISPKGKALSSGKNLEISLIGNASTSDNSERILSGISEVDNVLGGGLVRGSVTLIAGQPGIGKSTLMLQLSAGLSKTVKTLYASGEESAHQVGLRAERLRVAKSNIQLATTTTVEDILKTIHEGKYDVVVVDSIQTITTDSVPSAAGSVTQITNCAHMLITTAKQTNTAIILVGHVTKEGSIAGPKVLEHVVDTVLQLEGDRYGGFKVLRSIKNRYGATSETGIFEMQEEGLIQVENPSAALLSERQVTDGSIVLATMEGSRPMLVEVQALVNKTSYGYPKRASSGIELNRLNLLIAMLERRTKLQLHDQDIYINIVGGLKIVDPGVDLAVCLAIASASKGMQLKEHAVVFGEVGLSGEVRHVPFSEKRISEAVKLGFDIAIGPKSAKKGKKVDILQPVTDVREALNRYLKT